MAVYTANNGVQPLPPRVALSRWNSWFKFHLPTPALVSRERVIRFNRGQLPQYIPGITTGLSVPTGG